MFTIDDLKARAQAPKVVVGNADFTLMLDSNAVVEEVIIGLSAYFGEDNERQAIRLIVQGKEIGYLTRTGLYEFIELAERGIGDADNALLPGRPAYRLIELHCPFQGCESRMLVTSVDNLPACPVHAGVRMEISP